MRALSSTFSILLVSSLIPLCSAIDYLIYGGTSSVDYEALLTSLGKTFQVATDAQWSAMTAADFQKFSAIVLPDPTCSNSIATKLAVPLANRNIWSSPSVITGNVVIIGTDEHYHWRISGVDRGRALARNMLLFAGSEVGKTGLYVSLSCYYSGTTTPVAVALLDQFTTDKPFQAVQPPGCFDNAHIVATHPSLVGLTDALLANWGCSVHEIFTTFPKEFIPLVIARLPTGLTFADGSVGTPYILARGASLSPVKCGDGIIQAPEQCDDGNTVPNDGCSEKCRTEFCGDGIVQKPREQCDNGSNLPGSGCNNCKIEAVPPVCSKVVASVASVWPPDGRLEKIVFSGAVTSPPGGMVNYTVLRINQTEPTMLTPADTNCPDGFITTSSIRIERESADARNTLGRTYFIDFKATQPDGQSCTGRATICVSPNQCGTCAVPPDAILYDSTTCNKAIVSA